MKQNHTLQRALVTGALLFGCISAPALQVCAAENTAVIDTEKTASLTIEKKNGEALSDLTGTEGQQTVAEAVEKAGKEGRLEGLSGVSFRYLRIGTIGQTVLHENGKDTVLTGFALSDAGSALLGTEEKEALFVREGIPYYDSALLQEKLESFRPTQAMRELAVDQLLSEQGTAMAATDENGRTRAEGLPVGLYLAGEYSYPTEVESTCAPFLVSLPMTDPQEKGSAWIYDVTVYPKNRTADPQIDKVIVDEGMEAKAADYRIGDSISYLVRADVPKAVGKTRVYTITDSLSPGLTFEKSSASLQVQGVKADGSRKILSGGREYTFRQKEGKLEFVFSTKTLAGQDGMRLYDGIEIRYRARLNRRAEIGGDGNENTAQLTWSRSTNTDSGETVTVQPQEDPRVYTYALELLKYGGSDRENRLSGVEFTLKDGEGKTVQVAQTGEGTGSYAVDPAGSGVLTTDSRGTLSLKGLGSGEYVLTETRTREGYRLLRDPVTIRIESTEFRYEKADDGTWVKADSSTEYRRSDALSRLFHQPEDVQAGAMLHTADSGITAVSGSSASPAETYRQQEFSWSGNFAMGQGDSPDSGVLSIEVQNMKNVPLPVTGGSGVTLYLAIGGGCLVLAGCTAAGAVYFRRRHDREEKRKD